MLLALRYLGRAGTADLAAATGYGHEAVTEGLRGLASMGFVVQASRYHGWQLTPPAVQLPLFIPAQFEDGRKPAEANHEDRERQPSAFECGKTASTAEIPRSR